MNPKIERRTFLVGGVATASLGLSGALSGADAQAEKVLRIAMTASDIPLTAGGPDNGFEGFRFTGYTIYDALINWDLRPSDKPAALAPGLATSWTADPADRKRWTLKLRQGVKFHDGSTFDADAVIWNIVKLFDDKAPHYDQRASAQIKSRVGSLASWKKIDDSTVELTTRSEDAFFPYQLTFLLISSPAQFEKLGRDWQAFAAQPSGTGPFKLERLQQRERAELVANREYWDAARRPKVDRIILRPIPEASARTAALLAGQVDWIEAVAPDQAAQIAASGARVETNDYPHGWNYMLSYQPDSPFKDIRVRKAINLAIDREGLKQVLNGFMKPAVGMVQPNDPWFGKPGFKITHDPAQARKLLAEAGYGPTNPLTFRVIVSTSGSGQMQPLLMNEFIQQNLADVGVKLELEVMEWGTLLARWRAGAISPQNKGLPALNVSAGLFDPFSAFVRYFDSVYAAPNGFNWGGWSNPDYDALIGKARTTFDIAEQNRLLGEIHSRAVDDALFVWIAHDVNPRGLSKRVKPFVPANSWYVDLTAIELS
ncbi:ABC transporter substrate-binding protein [Bosea sp. (in: a-proteobacteria)]|uniref:ABC transporter substrate-binding protein n=1 Tax=Bosea sp. (in: a-proteobacteria) TaxID=1871050 RepID=UPI002625DEB8|nr:ABC transporter substrate-binding protein [Bosea sp. (in: a-proteobacteria)]MCO5089520.1 ABC transporter substrate-binding protein [Bosea sp. (in: a-proteobacteria)]